MSGKGERISSLNRLIIENSGTRSRHWELGGAGRGGGGGALLAKWSFAFSPGFWRLGEEQQWSGAKGGRAGGRDEEGRSLSSGPALPDLKPESLPLKMQGWV